MQSNILDTIDMRELGIELLAARKRSGLRQEDAARLINVARTTISAIEKGERRITSEELFKLALGYGVQVSDLVRQRPKVNPSPEQFRGPDMLTPADREIIQQHIAQLIEFARNYVELEDLLNAPLVRKYPPEYSWTHLAIDRAAENIALEERQRLSLGDGPIGDLRALLEQYVGLRIFYLPLPSRFSEIYLFDDTLGGCIAVNRQHPADRRRMSLAHGYLHFLAHRHSIDVSENIPEGGKHRRWTPQEKLADAFARYFLMPTAGLLRRYNDIVQTNGRFSTTDLLTLANLYGVSVEALALRLEDMERLPAGKWASLKKREIAIRDFQKQLGLGPVEATNDVFPRRYQLLAVAARLEELVSEQQFAYLLQIDRVTAREHLEILEPQLHGGGDDTLADSVLPRDM